MVNTKFELYKLRRELRRNGKDFTFYRNEKNEFGECVGDKEVVVTIRGLYHETNSYKTTTFQDGSTTVNEKQPMILCAVEDVAGKGLKIGDYVEVDDSVYLDKKKMKLSGIVDILDFGIIADISLEVVDDARSS